MRGKLNPQVLTCMDEGEHSQLCMLHLPWPRALLALGLLAGLIKPPLQYLRHWSLGCMVEQEGGGADAKGHRIARPCVAPMHRGKRASKRALI